MTSRYRTLIDNIFLNSIDNGISLGNITSTVSDHYGQFFLTRNTTQKNDKETYRHKFVELLKKMLLKKT